MVAQRSTRCSLHFRETVSESVVLFLEDEDEGNLVDVFLFAELGVSSPQDLLGVMDTHHLERLAQVAEWHALDAKDIIGVKDGLEVLLHQVVIDAALWVLELVDLLAKGIARLLLLNCFQIFNDVVFGIGGTLVQDPREYLIKQLRESVVLHVLHYFLHALGVLVADADLGRQLLPAGLVCISVGQKVLHFEYKL